MKPKYKMFLDRVRSYMIVKAIEGSITKTSLKKLRLHLREFELTHSEGVIINYVPTIIEIIFKNINRATINIVSNLKYEIEKATLAKFGNNTKNLLDVMSSN